MVGFHDVPRDLCTAVWPRLILMSAKGDIWDRVDLAQSKQSTAGEEGEW